MKKTKKVFSVALSMLMAFTPVSGLLSLTACDGAGSPAGPGQSDTYDVRFNLGDKGATPIAKQEVAKGEKATQPESPTATGWIFGGWYSNSECTEPFDFNTAITKNTTVYAKWIENAGAVADVNVTFMVKGSTYHSTEVAVGSTVTFPEAPVGEGEETFVGWYRDAGCTSPFYETDIITSETVIYAKFVIGTTFTVSFVADRGTAPAPQTIEVNKTAKYPIEKPTDVYNIFAGWFTEETCENLYDFSTPVTGDITLYAGYQEVPDADKVQIRFGGYTVDGTQKTTYDKMVQEFNATYGKYNGISVTNSIVGNWAEYQNRASTALTEEGGFDIYMINDRNFKAWAQTRNDQIRNIGAGEDFTGNTLFDQQLDGMWTGMINRFRLNVDGWTSYEDDDLWVVPIDSNPTALYYNRTVLEKNGIIVISVEDITITADNWEDLCIKYDGNDVGEGALEDVGFEYAEGKTLLNLWNEDLICDLFHNFHSELKFVTGDQLKGFNGEEITSDYFTENDVIPAKGFYRSFHPRIKAESNTYVAPAINELLVFNASIAMSWDEVEDIGMICTKTNNSNSASTYGYFTQWWFCYGWTVGGDCVEDMTGDGTWAFSLSDYTANYLVTEAACTQSNPNDANDTNKYYIGEYTGKLYSAGQTLDFLDKIDVEKLIVSPSGSANSATAGDIILPNPDGSFTKYNIETATATTIGKGASEIVGTTDTSAIRASITTVASQDQNQSGIKFVELPSTKEAFSRFCHLCPSDVDDESIGVSYATSTTASDETADITKLGNGTVAFVIERGDKLGHLRNVAREYNQSWGVANVPVFKEYANPGEPSNDTVKRMGVQAGHSECVAIGISAGCKDANLDEAWQFIQWMAADYFYLDADGYTYFGNQRSNTDVRYRAGQAVKADNGYIPNQPSLFETPDEESAGDRVTFIKAGEENLNLHLFAYAIEYESAGDWWYLPSSAWINEWATTLNASTGVRGGQMTAAAWFNSGIINKTNQVLAEDYSYFYDAANIIDQWERHIGADIQA
ncbi:MAG: InlB B-repeat-containing protein [Clostridia bacterium]|nr:InlB B-repeat-containing protein [Clostridia bacterium]